MCNQKAPDIEFKLNFFLPIHYFETMKKSLSLLIHAYMVKILPLYFLPNADTLV